MSTGVPEHHYCQSWIRHDNRVHFKSIQGEIDSENVETLTCCRRRHRRTVDNCFAFAIGFYITVSFLRKKVSVAERSTIGQPRERRPDQKNSNNNEQPQTRPDFSERFLVGVKRRRLQERIQNSGPPLRVKIYFAMGTRVENARAYVCQKAPARIRVSCLEV